MASNASRGAAAKARTKKWLIAQGWQVADLEKVHWIFTPKGRIPTKKDQWASDLIAMRAWVGGGEIACIQVKSGASARGGTFPAARREFAKFVFPQFVDRWIIAWPPRARVPRVVNAVTGEEYGEEARQGREDQSTEADLPRYAVTQARSLRRR